MAIRKRSPFQSVSIDRQTETKSEDLQDKSLKIRRAKTKRRSAIQKTIDKQRRRVSGVLQINI